MKKNGCDRSSGDPKEFLRLYYDVDEVTSFSAGILGDVHSFYQQSFVDLGLDLPSKDGGQASLRVLDYGAGAVIVFDISAAAVATEIVLAEYAPQNRAALQQWVDGDAEARTRLVSLLQVRHGGTRGSQSWR